MVPPTAVVAPSQAVAAPTPGMFGEVQSVLPPSGVIPLSYTPVTHHWFYAQFIELRQCWKPFSIADSSRLEDAFRAGKNLIIVYNYISFLLRKLWFIVSFTRTCRFFRLLCIWDSDNINTLIAFMHNNILHV